MWDKACGLFGILYSVCASNTVETPFTSDVGNNTSKMPLIHGAYELFSLNEPLHEISNNGVMCDEQSLRSACAYAQFDQSLC